MRKIEKKCTFLVSFGFSAFSFVVPLLGGAATEIRSSWSLLELFDLLAETDSLLAAPVGVASLFVGVVTLMR